MEKTAVFIRKLSQILKDEKVHDIISWSIEGDSFQIHSSTEFIEKVLPLYFKHANMASFIRQLNMYGFTRHGQPHQIKYWNPEFRRSDPQKYGLIGRKGINKKQTQNKGKFMSIQSSHKHLDTSIHQKEEFSTKLLQLKKQNKKLLYHNRRLTYRLQKIEELNRNLQKNTLKRAVWRNKQESAQIAFSAHPFPSDFQEKNSSVSPSKNVNHEKIEIRSLNL